MKLLVSSFYNTIIDKEEAIPMSTMLQIDRVKSKGTKFVIMTNRLSKELDFYNRDFPFIDYIISLNGSYVYDVNNENVIYERKINLQTIQKILDIFPNNKVSLFGYDSVYKRDEYSDKDIYKIEIEIKNKDLEKIESLNIKDINKSILKVEKKTYLELTSTQPLNGLNELTRYLNVKKDEVLTIIGNDSEKKILKEYQNTYIIGNSPKDMKLLTNKKTSSNNFKGVEKVIKKEIK